MPMISLQISAEDSVDVLELLIRSGYNKIADSLKIEILKKLKDHESIEEARLVAATNWLSKQKDLISSIREEKNVG